MIIHGGEFLAHFDSYRIVSITGFRGSGKDLLAFELAQHWLEKGYKFYSNQRSIWNDPLYRMSRGDEGKDKQLLDARGEIIDYIADIKKRVYVLSEGGRYLRKWAYFEDIFEYARKLDVFVIIPSVRVGHEDLAQLLVSPMIPFRTYLGFNGGIWWWQVDTGITKKYGGWFLHLPELIGVYDTHDLSENTNSVLEAFQRTIERIQLSYGRDKLQTVADATETIDAEFQAAIARKLGQAAISISSAGRKGKG